MRGVTAMQSKYIAWAAIVIFGLLFGYPAGILTPSPASSLVLAFPV